MLSCHKPLKLTRFAFNATPKVCKTPQSMLPLTPPNDHLQCEEIEEQRTPPSLRSQPTIDHIEPPLPRKRHPIHLLHPPARHHGPPLLLTHGDEQLPRATGILPNAAADLKRLGEVDGLDFRVRRRGRDPGHEEGKHVVPAFQQVGFGVGGGEVQDRDAPRFDVGLDGGCFVLAIVGEDGVEALRGEHAGVGVDDRGLVEEEGLWLMISFTFLFLRLTRIRG